MSHNKQCRSAKSPGCKCAGCGGSRHGWPGYLERAGQPAEFRRTYRAAADRKWSTALGPEKNRAAGPKNEPNRSNLTIKRAATDSAVADIVDWIAGNGHGTGRVERVRQVGELIANDTLSRLEDQAEELLPENVHSADLRRNIAGHFWCSLLAEISGAADTADGILEKVPEQATAALMDSDGPPVGEVKSAVAEYTLKAIWEGLGPLVLSWDIDTLVRIVRVLAVLICPAPGRHPRVVRLCLSPLGRDVLTETSEARIQQGFGDALDA